MKIKYVDHKFNAASQRLIDLANEVIAEYAGQGFDLTLRQLYYQLVARGYIPNTDRSYKSLGNLISDARLAGLVDWDAIVDRTRNLRALSHWGQAEDVLQAAEKAFHVDMWANQRYRPEVWIEKDALIGVIAGVCQRFDVPYFACRGYVSQSEMFVAAVRIIQAGRDEHKPLIIHLGDHDPSGIDMTRDLIERLCLLSGREHEQGYTVERIALNYDQVQRYNPPPNPAKLTDSRVDGYISRYGRSSWELDALEPQVIADLIETTVVALIDRDAWESDLSYEETVKTQLRSVHENWDVVLDTLEDSDA